MALLLNLEGKVALVTGGSRGIGAAIAERLAGAGAAVALTGRAESDLQGVANLIKSKHGSDVMVHTGDVREEASVQSLYRGIFSRFGKLDILAANAGVLGDGLLGMLRESDIRTTLDTNIVGTLHHLQAAARLMRRGKSGSIVVTSSIIGREGNKGQVVYAASKAALIGAVRSAAKELGADQIRVNAVAPGIIETDMTRHLSGVLREKRLADIALGHFGMAQDVADAVLFLASELSRYVSGQVIGVDGGMVI